MAKEFSFQGVSEADWQPLYDKLMRKFGSAIPSILLRVENFLPRWEEFKEENPDLSAQLIARFEQSLNTLREREAERNAAPTEQVAKSTSEGNLKKIVEAKLLADQDSMKLQKFAEILAGKPISDLFWGQHTLSTAEIGPMTQAQEVAFVSNLSPALLTYWSAELRWLDRAEEAVIESPLAAEKLGPTFRDLITSAFAELRAALKVDIRGRLNKFLFPGVEQPPADVAGISAAVRRSFPGLSEARIAQILDMLSDYFPVLREPANQNAPNVRVETEDSASIVAEPSEPEESPEALTLAQDRFMRPEPVAEISDVDPIEPPNVTSNVEPDISETMTEPEPEIMTLDELVAETTAPTPAVELDEIPVVPPYVPKLQEEVSPTPTSAPEAISTKPKVVRPLNSPVIPRPDTEANDVMNALALDHMGTGLSGESRMEPKQIADAIIEVADKFPLMLDLHLAGGKSNIALRLKIFMSEGVKFGDRLQTAKTLFTTNAIKPTAEDVITEFNAFARVVLKWAQQLVEASGFAPSDAEIKTVNVFTRFIILGYLAAFAEAEGESPNLDEQRVMDFVLNGIPLD